MRFLKEIKKYKKRGLKARNKSLEEVRGEAFSIERRPGFFIDALKKPGLSLIAEVKMASPSKGKISKYGVDELAGIYEKSGADCASVLTEENFFYGSLANIRKVRNNFSRPVLMKDFIISEYQIYEGAAAGADAVLLIAAMLSRGKLKKYLRICRDLGISAIVEVHSRAELRKCLSLKDLEILGVNSRNLKTLEINYTVQEKIAGLVPAGLVLVAESGINTCERAVRLFELGYNAVLIGEWLVASETPAEVICRIKSVGADKVND
jgi:indole-3-glycerol phosphate synthase